MKTLVAIVVAVVAVICCCGALLVDPRLGALAGVDPDMLTADTDADSAGCPPAQCPPGGDWVAPVPHGITSGYLTPERPDHHGVDLGSPRGTTVVAASDGVVELAECSARLEDRWYGCDVDGSPAVSGCGWHVTVAHAHDIVTVYCHFDAAPHVSPGDSVAAGQAIGVVGTTGNSSGPHLHFEVNHGTWGAEHSLDPVAFMRDKGVSL